MILQTLAALSFLLAQPPVAAADNDPVSEHTADIAHTVTETAPDRAPDHQPDYPEARAYDASIDATAEIDAALARALRSGRYVMVVMGANWCHDSRAFAGWMQSEKFAQLTGDWYEIIYVNVGMPQTDDGHNLHIAKRFGIDEIEGTPTVLLLSNEAILLNADTAGSWRDTASRSGDAIFEELSKFPFLDHDF